MFARRIPAEAGEIVVADVARAVKRPRPAPDRDAADRLARRRLLKGATVRLLKTQGWSYADIGVALRITPQHARRLDRTNRAYAEALRDA